MRTTLPLVIVLAMMITAGFFAGSGFNGLVDGEANIDPLEQEVEERSADSVTGSGNFSASRSGTEDGSIVGLVVSGAQDVIEFTSLVVLLPITLQQIGFPVWFALPIGAVLQIIVSIGVLQFITGRVYR
jgi:hypothetical protein